MPRRVVSLKPITSSKAADLQREFAEKLVAPPGSSMRGRKREEHRRVGNCNCDSENVIRAGGGNTNLTVPPRSSFYDKVIKKKIKIIMIGISDLSDFNDAGSMGSMKSKESDYNA